MEPWVCTHCGCLYDGDRIKGPEADDGGAPCCGRMALDQLPLEVVLQRAKWHTLDVTDPAAPGTFLQHLGQP